MAKDILGQQISVGSRVLWAHGDKESGFAQGRPHRVVRITATRVTLHLEGRRFPSSVPPTSLVVVDRLLAQDAKNTV